jgi:hypothetical protein
MHYEKRGKLEVISTVPVKNKEDLSLGTLQEWQSRVWLYPGM